MKKKKVLFIIAMVVSVFTLVSCGKQSKENEDSKNEIKQDQSIEDNNGKTNENSSNDKKENKVIESNKPTKIVTKIEGRRKEFLERLDNIQKEIDVLPEKKDSDAGVTNAMKNYYGKAYEMYDKELNEIYSLLKKELSPEVMDVLEQEEIKWIEEKENMAKQESSKYKGGTFEFVADKVSLYESTKNRCYELVNNYMTD